MVKKPTFSQATRIESETDFLPCESMKDGAIFITGTLFNIIVEKILDCHSVFKREFREEGKSHGLERNSTNLNNEF